MTNKSTSRIAKNTTMLVLLNLTKIALPFLTLPYLTRVLSTDCYGTVAYVKAVMGYMQTLVDFGFILSATKRVTEANGNKEKIGCIVGDNIVAKLLIALVGTIGLLVLILCLPILQSHVLFTFLSYGTVVLTIFLLDFLFRGIEKMEVITYRFLAMKSLSTILTFLVVKGDTDILWIPILDIIGSVVAIGLVFRQVRKEEIIIRFSGIRNSIELIKESATYFLSNVASVSFNIFSTIIMGLVMSTTDIAYWSVCIQIISAVQAILNPVSDAIYPEMIRTKSRRIIRKVLKVFLPLVAIGCVAAFVLAPVGLYIVGGEKYLPAVLVFRILIPVIPFSFLAILFGWPTLGVIGKIKETTRTTVISVIFQISLITIVTMLGYMTLYIMAIIRAVTEGIMFLLRYRYYRRFIEEFKE